MMLSHLTAEQIARGLCLFHASVQEGTSVHSLLRMLNFQNNIGFSHRIGWMIHQILLSIFKLL